MTWRDAYLQQAWSDFKVYLALNANNYALCHQLHYLQMTTEKLAKGFQCPTEGKPYPKTHFAFVKFLQQIKQQPLIPTPMAKSATTKDENLAQDKRAGLYS